MQAAFEKARAGGEPEPEAAAALDVAEAVTQAAAAQRYASLKAETFANVSAVGARLQAWVAHVGEKASHEDLREVNSTIYAELALLATGRGGGGAAPAAAAAAAITGGGGSSGSAHLENALGVTQDSLKSLQSSVVKLRSEVADKIATGNLERQSADEVRETEIKALAAKVEQALKESGDAAASAKGAGAKNDKLNAQLSRNVAAQDERAEQARANYSALADGLAATTTASSLAIAQNAELNEKLRVVANATGASRRTVDAAQDARLQEQATALAELRRLGAAKAEISKLEQQKRGDAASVAAVAALNATLSAEIKDLKQQSAAAAKQLELQLPPPPAEAAASAKDLQQLAVASAEMRAELGALTVALPKKLQAVAADVGELGAAVAQHDKDIQRLEAAAANSSSASDGAASAVEAQEARMAEWVVQRQALLREVDVRVTRRVESSRGGMQVNYASALLGGSVVAAVGWTSAVHQPGGGGGGGSGGGSGGSASSWVSSFVGGQVVAGGAAEYAIDGDLTLGNCFAMAGQRGQLTVQLAQEVEVLSVSLEHVFALRAPNVSNAVKAFEAWGYRRGETASGGTKLGTFLYSIDHKMQPALQVFDLPRPMGRYAYVKLKVLSNHGHRGYTAVYSFGVHSDVALRWEAQDSTDEHLTERTKTMKTDEGF